MQVAAVPSSSATDDCRRAHGRTRDDGRRTRRTANGRSSFVCSVVFVSINESDVHHPSWWNQCAGLPCWLVPGPGLFQLRSKVWAFRLGPWVWALGLGLWVLGFGPWALGLGPWALGLGLSSACVLIRGLIRALIRGHSVRPLS